MASILVTDGEQRAALAVVRSLGRAGHRVYVCSTRGQSLAGASRHAHMEAAVPDPLSNPTGFVASVAARCRSWAVGMVLPITEPSLLALLPARDDLGGVHIPFPAADVFRAISDKARVMEAAAEVGISVPEQRVLLHPTDRAAILPSPLPFPVVLKPARSVGEADGSRRKVGVRHAANPAQIRRELDALPAAAYPLLVQQRVIGPGVGIFLLLHDGEPVATFAHRRIREKPPSGGVSVYRESIAADPELVQRSTELLRRFDWEGVAMVEYKLDGATGTPYLMEINGRFWGSLQLAVDAGVDFPGLLVDVGLGQRPAPVTTYRTGVRSRWWWGDVDHLLARMRRSDSDLALPPDSPGRARAILDFMRLWRPGDRNEIFRAGDPRPLLRETADWFRGR